MNEHSNPADDRDETAARAYERWVRRNQADQHRDWLDAEAEVLHVRVPSPCATEPRLGVCYESVLADPLAECEARLAELLVERLNAERCLAGEHDVSRLLAGSAQFSDAASHILQAICASLSWDVGAFWIVDRDAGVLRCVEVWHVPTIDARDFELLTRDSSLSSGVGLPGRVWASATSEWVPDVTREADFPRFAPAARGALHAAVGFPIHNGAGALGVMEFFSREIRQPDARLLDMMRSIGSGISEFIERRRAEELLLRQEQERRLAQQIQEGLLPRHMPAPLGFSIAGRCSPSRLVGGDYFDFFDLADGSLGIAIGDASGHGVAAALVIAATRAYLRAFASTSCDLNAILTLTNRRLAEDLGCEHFVTLFLARLDSGARSLVYASAGHCPGYVLDAAGHVRTVLKSCGTVLGLDTERGFPVSADVILEPGDLLFLHTDGVVEAASAVGAGMFGVERALCSVAEHRHAAPEDILAALFDAVSHFSGVRAPGDDMSGVIIKSIAV